MTTSTIKTAIHNNQQNTNNTVTARNAAKLTQEK
jgi:hypothetical protein